MIYQAVNQDVLRAVPSDAGSLLDVGCGSGALGHAIKQRQTCRVVGLTNAQEEAQYANQTLDEVVLTELESFQPDHNKKFDVIVCSHVLEHLRNAHELLMRLQKCSSPTTLLIVALPNALHWKQRLEFMKGRFRYTSGGIMDETHVRFFDWNTARLLIEDAGWTIKTATAAGRFPLLWRYQRVGSILNHFASQTWPGLLGEQFVFTATVERG